MTKRQLINYCLEHYDCILDYPFDEVTAVMKLTANQKMFALISERNESVYINLKCNPDEALILRDQFGCITEGYHMNKKHWNTVILDGDVPFELVQTMMDDSYDLVKPKMKK